MNMVVLKLTAMDRRGSLYPNDSGHPRKGCAICIK